MEQEITALRWRHISTMFACCLRKALYGLKQVPRMWFNLLKNFLRRLGFVASKCDPLLFVYVKGWVCMFLLIYVDDIVVTSSNQSVVNSILRDLGVEFALRELRELEFFLGIQAHSTATNLHLNQA